MLKTNRLPPGRVRSSGERGPQGPQGPRGAPGMSGYERVVVQASSYNDDFQGLEAECSPGKKVLGGGLSSDVAGQDEDFELRYSRPNNDLDGWYVGAHFEGDGRWWISAWAICAYVQ